MAKTTYVRPIASMTGRLSKKESHPIISRQKIYRDETGRVIAEGISESYAVKHPRNYRKSPMSAAEQKTVNAFSQALAQYSIEKDDPERMEYWRNRWRAQLKKGDPEASIDPKTGRRRIYPRLDVFIRSMLQLHFRRQ